MILTDIKLTATAALVSGQAVQIWPAGFIGGGFFIQNRTNVQLDVLATIPPVGGSPQPPLVITLPGRGDNVDDTRLPADAEIKLFTGKGGSAADLYTAFRTTNATI